MNKLVNKEYLAKQFYLYNKEYILSKFENIQEELKSDPEDIDFSSFIDKQEDSSNGE